MKWIEEIVKVFKQNDGEAMHYAIIAELVVNNNPEITQKNATPNQTVNLYLNKYSDLFERVSMGVYRLKESVNKKKLGDLEITDEEAEKDRRKGSQRLIIKAYGIHWKRKDVDWNKQDVKIWGSQSNAMNVNFATMRGVYVLHYGQDIIYVGQTTSNTGIGKRLRDHTRDRLSNRWDGFSWFGLDSVNSSGEIVYSQNSDFKLSIQNIADVLEGMLLEILEPKSNRRGANGFAKSNKNNEGAFEIGEYSQVVDESFEKEQFITLMAKYFPTK